MTETRSARLHQPEIEKIEELSEEQGLSRSETMRRLIEEGLEQRESETEQSTTATTGLLSRLGWSAIALAVSAIAVDVALLAGVAGVVAALLFAAGAVIEYRA